MKYNYNFYLYFIQIKNMINYIENLCWFSKLKKPNKKTNK